MHAPKILTQKQTRAWFDFLEPPHWRRILFDGGARSSKTFVAVAWLVYQAATYAGARILIARKHRNAAKKSVWDETLRPYAAPGYGVTLAESDLELRFANGSVIRCDGLDDQERVDKILGTEYAHIFFNEATQLSYATVQTVLSRLAQAVPGLPARKAIFDCNPKSQRHWLYRVGVQHLSPDSDQPLPDAGVWTRLHWTPHDNPHLPADALATLQSLTGVQRRRMLLGEWCEQAGAVYAEFDETLHVFTGGLPPGADGWDHVRGIDFGYTNPFVCLWGAVDGDGCLWVYREHYRAGVLVTEHALAIKNAGKLRYRWTVADHDAGDRATLHAAGIATIAARKDVQAGIAAMKARLTPQANGRPRLMVSAECVRLIGELYDYAWPAGQDGRDRSETPAKVNDHALDALRYMVMQLDGAPATPAQVTVFGLRTSPI